MTKIYEKTYENGRKKIRFLGIKISYKDNKIKYSPLHTDKTKAPIRIAFYVGCEDNRSERYRVDNIVEELTNCGIIADRYYPGSLDELKKSTNYDLLVIFRVGEFNRPLFPKIVDTIKIFQKHNIPIIYDVDDYLFSNRIPEEIQNDVQEIIENANAITVTTNALKIKYQKFCNNVQIIKNTINFHQMQLASKTVKRKKHNTMKIVYQSGHASHTYDFTACEKALINIMKKYKNVEFHLIGPCNVSKEFKSFVSRFIRQKYMPYLKLQKYVSNMDINIAPLEINDFNNCKSELKIFEAALLNIPTIVSPIEPYKKIIQNGHNGFIATTLEEWENYFEILINNKKLREEIAQNANSEIVPQFYIKNLINDIIDIYKKVIENAKKTTSERTKLSPKNNKTDINKLNIAFIVPPPIKGSGGHRNIYRAVKFLKEFGHDITVYYTDINENADLIKRRVSRWFYNMSDTQFIHYEGTLGYHDVCIATWWKTAYDLLDNIDKIKYPFYFVQDFEPWFSPMSSDYILAENSYKLGFSHICSGKWCSDFLQNKYNAQADYFQFPVDKDIYNVSKPKTKQNKNIIFFAKPEMPRRCYEIGLNVLKIIKEKRPDIEIIMYGSNHIDQETIPFTATVKKMLPTLHDLADLYRNATLGIVFSTTNPSLVPYEMMACGCPVADLDANNALAKYGDDINNVFLFNTYPKKFAQELLDIIDNDKLLELKSKSGQAWVNNEFPTEPQMAKKVEEIIKNRIIQQKEI